MKSSKLIAFMSCLLFSSQVFSQTKHLPLEISHLTGDLYVYTTYQLLDNIPFPSNSLYLVTDEGAVMIDTPWDTAQFQPLLDSIRIKHNKKVVLCISTHFHEDRTGGLEFLRSKGIKTFTSQKTDELSRLHHKNRAAFLFSKDTTFTAGQYKFQTYYAGAGHSPDNIVIWFPNDKVLYGGCLIKSVEAKDIGNLSDANVKEWPATMNNLKNKYPNPAYVIPGHQDWTNKNSIDHTLELLRKLN